jgi:DNA polymerase-4
MILLVDMDAFFASVEQAHHPHLRGQPVIVCGDPGRRGVVTAASYEARPSGVHAGMPLGEARRLCPRAHYVEGNPAAYVAISLRLLDLYTRVTPDVEPFSVDEAFLSVGRIGGSLEQARAIAEELQRRILAGFGLGASIGVGPNKLIAKMAAGVQKPRGLTALDESGYRDHFWPLPVGELWGVGPQLEERLRPLGIATVADLARTPAPILEGAFGIIGPQLREAAWGRDDTPLVPYHRGIDAKSMGHEVTLPQDCRDASFLEGTLLRLSDQVTRRMRVEGYRGRTVCLKLRDSAFVTRMRQRSLSWFGADHEEVFSSARALFRELWRGEPVRLLGVTVAQLERVTTASQGELFSSAARSLRLRDALDQVRDRLGEAVVVPAGALSHRRELGHVPFGALSARVPKPSRSPRAERDSA